MHLFMFLFVALLFFVLTPGVLLTLPRKGSKFLVAGTHALVFALVFTFTHKIVWEWGIRNGYIQKKVNEGMTTKPASTTKPAATTKHAATTKPSSK